MAGAKVNSQLNKQKEPILNKEAKEILERKINNIEFEISLEATNKKS